MNSQIFIIKKIFIITLVFLNISCVNKKVINGQLPDAEILSTLKIGVDKKEIIEQVLGSPSFKGDLGDNSMYYVASVFEEIAFLDPNLIDQKVLQIEFNKNNVLKNIYFYKKNEGRNIVMSKNFTQTKGRKIGFFEQMFSNFGLPSIGKGPLIGSGRAGD